jgi:hypothetical protein
MPSVNTAEPPPAKVLTVTIGEGNLSFFGGYLYGRYRYHSGGIIYLTSQPNLRFSH